MKLKKGDVYKWKHSIEWFKLKEEKSGGFITIINKRLKYWMSYEFLIDQIHTGKLIKIPQLYK